MRTTRFSLFAMVVIAMVAGSSTMVQSGPGTVVLKVSNIEENNEDVFSIDIPYVTLSQSYWG